MLELIEDKEDIDYIEECIIRQVCPFWRTIQCKQKDAFARGPQLNATSSIEMRVIARNFITAVC